MIGRFAYDVDQSRAWMVGADNRVYEVEPWEIFREHRRQEIGPLLRLYASCHRPDPPRPLAAILAAAAIGGAWVAAGAPA